MDATERKGNTFFDLIDAADVKNTVIMIVNALLLIDAGNALGNMQQWPAIRKRRSVLVAVDATMRTRNIVQPRRRREKAWGSRFQLRLKSLNLLLRHKQNPLPNPNAVHIQNPLYRQSCLRKPPPLRSRNHPQKLPLLRNQKHLRKSPLLLKLCHLRKQSLLPNQKPPFRLGPLRNRNLLRNLGHLCSQSLLRKRCCLHKLPLLHKPDHLRNQSLLCT